ncbi:MAG: YabP/YqfC family sporulation protein [Clostridia bacterium]|nr:YabP/YqfC family sporulation protein [Clostridia bacterium]
MREEKSEKNAKGGKDKNERQSIGERLRKTLELDGDILPHSFMLEVRGRSGLMLRGAGRILLYTPEEIRLRVRGAEISVRGEGLICSSYYADAVGIEGRISSISFEEAER